MKKNVLTLIALACLSTSAGAQTTLEETIASKLDDFDKVTPTARPRLLKGKRDAYGIVAAALAERRAGLNDAARLSTVDQAISTQKQLVANFKSSDEAVHDGSLNEVRRQLERALEAAFVFYVLGDAKYLNELEQRIEAFAPTIIDRKCAEKPGYITAQRDYVFYLAAAYDLVRDHPANDTGQKLSETSRNRVYDVVALCSMQDNVKNLLTSVATTQFDGTVFNAINKVIGAQLLLRKDSEFEERIRLQHSTFDHAWLRKALQVWVSRMPLWGGNDGGYSNGSSYMLWGLSEQLLGWDVIDRVLGFALYSDLHNMPAQYVNNAPEFLLFTQPPGAPRGAFGDGAEVKRTEEINRIGKSLMNRLFSDITKWFVKDASTDGDDQARIDILLSVRENSDESKPPEPTAPEHLSAGFPSVGIAAFHSSLTDPQRLSILFRGSNQYGSANHAHPDMNSFVIYDKGKVLASDSGVYDEYNSDHRVKYAKTTKAHNAITFDIGKGQKDWTLLTTEKQSWGYRYPEAGPIMFNPTAPRATYSNAITASQFTQRGKRYDIVSSDVAYAYVEPLQQAKRTLIYLRPATIVVVDQLATKAVNGVRAARTWEWNLHTVAGRNSLGAADGGLGVAIGDASMCARVTSYQNGMVLQPQRTGYDIKPLKGDDGQTHFWHIWKSASPSADATIVSVLRTDCAATSWNTRSNVQFSNASTAKVTVDGALVEVSPTGVVVTDAP